MGLDFSFPRTALCHSTTGCGHGKFGFLFLHLLREALRKPAWAAALPFARCVRYVMTDVAPTNVAGLRARADLAAFVELGVLDFAVFDAGACAADAPAALDLLVSGVTLDADPNASGGGPAAGEEDFVVIANYVVDSLPCDAFRLRDGALQEGRVALHSKLADEPAAEAFRRGAVDPSLCSRMVTTFSYERLADGAAPYAGDASALAGDLRAVIARDYLAHFARRP